ncbi:MAG: proprotein convertase P-domain-containing protein [Polyangia bacterium]|jgi:hypothetical protein|nr:proprotein convertase P-domain-containing protein [Polyangia bacterium]
MRRFVAILGVLLLGLVGTGWSGCGSTSDPGDDSPNPFLEDQSNLGKADSAYLNPDGIEVEVDFEADVEATSWRIHDAPADLGAFAMTYFRKKDEFYLESLAEDANAGRRVEWLVNGSWITDAESRSVDASLLTRFRIRGINAVLLHGAGTGVTEGTFFTAVIPINPYNVMTLAGDKCADPDDHMTLDNSIYWYQWNPERSGCEMPTQEATVTISKLFRTESSPYLEYDQLLADDKITAVILFGQIGDGAVTDSDPGMRSFNQMARWLKQAGFAEVTPAPVGKRFSKQVGAVTVEIDIYSPYDFAGLSDSANFSNFQRALSEHEIVVYDGHSMLGASDFWTRPTYPDFYQIFLYGGCLGYEYYIRPILEGKGGWEKLDIVSSVVEVSADANQYAGPFLAKLLWAIENGNKVSWKDYLIAIRNRVGDSTFGASGVRDNCYSPNGSLCTPPVDPSGNHEYASTQAVPIPDDDDAGAASVISVPDSFTLGAVSVTLDVTHTWVGDLRITLEHGGTTVVLWDNEGGSAHDIQKTFTPEAFNGAPAQGDWTLKIVDSAGADTGTLQSWSIVLEAQ